MIVVQLAELLENRKLSQRELARRTGSHHDVISKFARQKTAKVSYELLDRVCAELGCQPGDLLVFKRADDQQIPLFEESDLGGPAGASG